MLEPGVSEEVAEEHLEVRRVEQVEGVNALAPDQTLEFGPSLTILFGENGSGKRATRASSGELRRSGLRKRSYRMTTPSPSARITFRLGDHDTECHWQNEAGIAPLTRISVFDSNAASLHVNTELGYVYTPAELALFEHVTTGLQKSIRTCHRHGGP